MIHLSIRRSTIRRSKTNYRLTILPKYSHCPKSIRHSKSYHPKKIPPKRSHHPKTRSHQTNSRWTSHPTSQRRPRPFPTHSRPPARSGLRQSQELRC